MPENDPTTDPAEPETPDPATDPETPPTDPASDPEPETFPRSYVEELRDEAAANRVRARRADELAREVFEHRVAALGRLADPTDLAFDEALLDDPDALGAAVDDLIARKPHLADRRPAGPIDQGARDGATSVDLAGMMRGLAS